MARSKMRQQVILAGDTTNSLAIVPPQSNDGTAITSNAIDRLGSDTGYFIFSSVAATGSPTAATCAIKIQDSDAAAGTYADFIVLETALDVNAAGRLEDYMVNLEGAKRYLKMVVDITYTGGTTPANLLAAIAILGDYDIDPKVAQTVLG